MNPTPGQLLQTSSGPNHGIAVWQNPKIEMNALGYVLCEDMIFTLGIIQGKYIKVLTCFGVGWINANYINCYV